MYNQYYSNYYRRNNRFGGGFAVPFILGGIAGSIWNNNRPIFFYPAPFFYQSPFPYRY